MLGICFVIVMIHNSYDMCMMRIVMSESTKTL